MSAVLQARNDSVSVDIGHRNAVNQGLETFSTLSEAIPCQGCGNPFRPKRRNQRHCRPACRVIAHNQRVDQRAASAFWDPDPGRPE